MDSELRLPNGRFAPSKGVRRESYPNSYAIRQKISRCDTDFFFLLYFDLFESEVDIIINQRTTPKRASG